MKDIANTSLAKEAPMFNIPRPHAVRHPSRRRQRRSRKRSNQARCRRRLDRKQRRRRLHQTRRARRRLERLHARLPKPARSLFESLAGSLRHATYLRFVLLAVAALLTVGPRTISNLLRTVGTLAPGHRSSYHRVFSQRRWSCWRLGYGLARWVLTHLVPHGPVYLAGDDTVDGHKGAQVFGKGCHRDAVRSTHSFTAYRWGHKWVVLAVLVRLPWTRRQWALPILVALYRTPKDNAQAGLRHKTPARLLRQLCCVLLHWFPKRRFILSGDGTYATHALAVFAARRRGRLVLVSKFYPDAQLYEAPPTTKGQCGRPRIKGAKLPTPQEVVPQSVQAPAVVAWYGGGQRRVRVVSGVGHWYQAGQGLVRVRWVFVHDTTGSHRDEYFFSTDVQQGSTEVIATYVGRWNEETTFQELRSCLGLETTRGWKEPTVLRVAPCLFGLYTVVVALYSQLPRTAAGRFAVVWTGKQDITFSDALRAVKRWLWRRWVFAMPAYHEVFEKLTRPSRNLLLHALTPAA
jgi:hypothetical protein